MSSRDGFSDAFDEMFLRSGRLAQRLLRDRSTAEEVAAEAMVRAYLHWPKIGGTSYRDAWVLRVTTNLSIDRARHRGPGLSAPEPIDTEAATALHITLISALAVLPPRQRDESAWV